MNSKKTNDVKLKLCVFCLSLTALAGIQAHASGGYTYKIIPNNSPKPSAVPVDPQYATAAQLKTQTLILAAYNKCLTNAAYTAMPKSECKASCVKEVNDRYNASIHQCDAGLANSLK